MFRFLFSVVLVMKRWLEKKGFNSLQKLSVQPFKCYGILKITQKSALGIILRLLVICYNTPILHKNAEKPTLT